MARYRSHALQESLRCYVAATGIRAETVRKYPSWIAGLHHRRPDGLNRAKFCLHHLVPGTTLTLVPEPTNAHSDHAVAIKLADFHIGYVPERHDWVYRALVDEGVKLHCVVEHVEAQGWLFRRARHVAL